MMPAISSGASTSADHDGSRPRLAPTSRSRPNTRSMFSLYAILISTTAYANCLLRLATAVIVPLGNTCTAPSLSRSTMVRRLICSLDPATQRDAVPLQAGESEARAGEPEAGDARQAERPRRQGARQLPRPRVHRGRILGADDLQRVEEVMDDEVRGADNEAGNDEGDDH